MNCRCASGGGHLPFPLKSSRPLPSRSARHPPPSGGGQEKHGGEGRLTQTLASPRLRGEGDRVSTSNLASPRSRWQGTTFPNPCLPRLQGGGGPRSGGRGAPSGRCLRSGHKNSVKGKGAIKHKGAPTIIYHCTDAPFRLAPLATHPLSGGGKCQVFLGNSFDCR